MLITDFLSTSYSFPSSDPKYRRASHHDPRLMCLPSYLYINSHAASQPASYQKGTIEKIRTEQITAAIPAPVPVSSPRHPLKTQKRANFERLRDKKSAQTTVRSQSPFPPLATESTASCLPRLIRRTGTVDEDQVRFETNETTVT